MKRTLWAAAVVASAVVGAVLVVPPASPQLVATAAKGPGVQQFLLGSVAPLSKPLPRSQLVRWRGPVEHLFFHTLVVRPDLAFYKNPSAQGLREYMVTTHEFKAILNQLWDNGWTLVDIHKAVRGEVYVPRGRKPFVLSEDDVNYYDYGRPNGQAWRMVLKKDGSVGVEIRDNHGTRVTDEDIVPLVDEFIARHPDFSAEGARGVLAPTGYEGLLGERLPPGDKAGAARVRALARALKADGWVFASHTWGHINLTTSGVGWMQEDIARWKALAEPLLGKTDVLIYPFGARPSPAEAAILAKQDGYTIQCDIDVVPRMLHVDGYTVMSRRHIDGIALDDAAASLKPFFNVRTVRDPQRPGL